MNSIDSAWTASTREELIGAVWLIVALLAYHIDVRWLMWLAGIHGGLTCFTAIVLAITRRPR